MKKEDFAEYVYLVDEQTKEIEKKKLSEFVDDCETEKEYEVREVTFFEVVYRRDRRSRFSRIEYFETEKEADNFVFKMKMKDFWKNDNVPSYFDSVEDAEKYIKDEQAQNE